MKGKLFIVYFILVITMFILMSCELQNEVKPLANQQEEKEQQKVEQIDYNIVLISPTNGSENISQEGTELVWKAYIKGTTNEATQLTFQVYLSDSQSPKKVLSDSIVNKINSGKLEANKIYYWQVIAKDKDGKTFESEVWSFKTKTPTLKSTVKIIPISPTNNKKQPNKNITFSWKLEGTESTDVTYSLLIDKSEDFSKALPVETNSSNYTLKEKLEKSTSYFWKVVAKFKNGETLESEPFTFTTVPPSTPVFSEATPLNEASNLEPVNLKFTWKFSDEDGDSLSYDYYLYESTITSTPLSSKTSISDNSVTLTEKLKYNQIYYWKVKATDEDNKTAESPIYKFSTMSEEEFTIQEQKKQLPEITKMFPKNGERISNEKKISWEYSKPLNDNLTAELLITKDKNATPLIIPISRDTTEYKIDPKQLEKDQTYYWKIRITNEKGISRESDWGAFLTQQPTSPSTPELLSPEDGSEVNPGKITLKWSKSIDEDGDNLTYTVLLGNTPKNLSEIATNLEKTELEIPNIDRTKTYYWKVIVKDEDYNKVESKISKFTTKLLRDIYVLTPKINASDVPVKNVRFEWEDEKLDGVKYIFRIGESKDKLSALPFELTENYYLYETKLKYDTTYYWRVDRRYQGKLFQGETYQFRTVKLPKPEKLSPIGVNKPTKNLVLSWEYPTLEVEKIVFDIYLGTDQNALEKIAENATSTTYVIPKRLDKEKTYYWKVIAKNDYGVSSESEVAKFETVPQTIPNKPILIEPINNSEYVDFENLKLSWDSNDADDDELKFSVYLDTTNPPQKLLTETKQKKYIIQKLLPDTTYYWQVVATDEEGKEVVSEINKFTTTKMIFYEDFEKEKYVLEKVFAKGLVKIREEPKKGKVLELKAEDGNSSEFSFELNLLTPSVLKFEYLVSSEEKCDFFLVYINNKQVYKDSGVKDWNVFEIELDPGEYTVKLVYKKDRIKYEGKDMILIDNIVVKYSF